MAYYHLSRDSNLTHLTPRVPETAVPTREDKVTPRICLSNSIDGCLSALQWNSDYYVYTPKNDIEVYVPTIEQVRDAKYTGEVWCLNEIEVLLLGKIETDDYIKTVQRNSGRGRVTVFYYPYCWVETTCNQFSN